MNSEKQTNNEQLANLNTPLVQSGYERPDPVGKRELPMWFRDITNLVIFVICVLIGVFLINHLIFQSFNVVGPSMEPTLEGVGSSDRLIVNRLPVTAAKLSGQQYEPNRGDIIVFKNPQTDGTTETDEYIVKRVIAFAGERVKIDDCTLKVYNQAHPNGYNPYPTFRNFASNDSSVNTCVDGDGTDVTVPTGRIFVVGDHRIGSYSMDSRDGDDRPSLGTIPLDDIVGPVALRIYPFNKAKVF